MHLVLCLRDRRAGLQTRGGVVAVAAVFGARRSHRAGIHSAVAVGFWKSVGSTKSAGMTPTTWYGLAVDLDRAADDRRDRRRSAAATGRSR